MASSVKMSNITVAKASEPVVEPTTQNVSETTDNSEVKTEESTEIKESGDQASTETPQEPQNESVNATEEPENTQETAPDTEPETAPEEQVVKKHVVSYIANGIWMDQAGKKWARNRVPGTDIESVREYTDAEYQVREDIKWMVDYGSMTSTPVSL